MGKAPLYHKYPNQSNPQGAYLELDLRDSPPTFRPNWNGEIGNAVPFAVWHGHIRRYPVSPCISQADDWIFSSCNIQEVWQHQSLEEVVKTLQSEADSEGIVIDGDLADSLCLQALHELDNNPERLTGTIMETLVRRGEIKREDFEDWKEKFAWM